MTSWTFSPFEIAAEVRAIPSKSEAHRLLIAAPLADVPTNVVLNGFTSADIPAEQAAFLNKMKQAASDRTRGIVDRVNPALSPLELDFDSEVLPLTPAGNATERHVCAA